MPRNDIEAKRAYDREYGKKNRAKKAKYLKEWKAKRLAEDPESFRESQRKSNKKFWANNRERMRAYQREYQRKRRAALKAVDK